MKDIIITPKKLKRERNIYLLSFILAFIINIIAVIVYTRPWIELISQIGYVIVISFLIYFLLWIPRGIYNAFIYLFRRKK
ncbi:hypothetical protein QR305_00711 [Bacteroides finegoldii]|uniref:Uncharacterized protein n=1 Tax=Bacteroides finegoldii CL09T03C10 TaxID=997888 RepID=K5CBP0_9BACE|nr:hypothetical protein [Bacteroides finegoldii]EKJ90459.1 hypothetical protein HMPREF1057_02494 [Bacteroides finegoldii CL09T03C10]